MWPLLQCGGVSYGARDHKTKNMTDPRLWVMLHVSSAERLTRVLSRYAAVFRTPATRLVVSVSPDLLEAQAVRDACSAVGVAPHCVVEVQNRGLDFGGFYDAYERVRGAVAGVDWVLKCHDKSRLEWLWGLMDPLMLNARTVLSDRHGGVYVSSHHLSRLGNHQMDRHAYWLTRLGHADARATDPMLAGGVFAMRRPTLDAWLQRHAGAVAACFTRAGRLDPSWFHYNYAERLGDASVPLWGSDRIRANPDAFEREMSRRFDDSRVANGMDHRGPALDPATGHAVRDGMFEHALERSVLYVGDAARRSISTAGQVTAF
jgi:hypothetical protein